MSDWLDVRKPRLIGFPTPSKNPYAYQRGVSLVLAYLFGSTARDDARDDSDVDLFFDYQKGKLGVYELMDVKEAASRILGHKADIMTRDSIHKRLRERIEAVAVPVF